MMAACVERALLHHSELVLAFWFGSHATGRARSDSDVDLAVLASQPIEVATEVAIAADVEAATGRAADVVDMRTAGEPLLGQLPLHGLRVRGTDTLQAEWLYRHLVDADDFLPYVERL